MRIVSRYIFFLPTKIDFVFVMVSAAIERALDTDGTPCVPSTPPERVRIDKHRARRVGVMPTRARAREKTAPAICVLAQRVRINTHRTSTRVPRDTLSVHTDREECARNT